MSAVCVLTPLVISSWPAIAAAVSGAAAALGYSLARSNKEASEDQSFSRTVETEIANSEIVAEAMTRGETMTIVKDDVTIEFRRDERGRCAVCVTGAKHSDRALRKIGEEVAGRVIQQFTYHKLLSELKNRKYHVAGEEVLQDDSVRVRVRL